MGNMQEFFMDIGINQRTVFGWFNLNAPQLDSYLPSRIPRIVADSTMPAFTMDTYDLLLEAISQKLRHGIIFEDINNMIVLIIAIRFIILSLKYNIWTSMKITLISSIAGISWFLYAKSVLINQAEELTQFPIFRALALDGMDLEDKAREIANAKFERRFRGQYADINIIRTIKSAWNFCTRAVGTTIDGELKVYTPLTLPPRTIISTYDQYYTDPIAMSLTYSKLHNLPLLKHPFLEKVYYFFARWATPKLLAGFAEWRKNNATTFLYTLCVRYQKKNCPYFLRWHWTTLLFLMSSEPYFLKMWLRGHLYLSKVIIPNYHRAFRIAYFNKFPRMQKYDMREVKLLASSFSTPYAIEYITLRLSLQASAVLLFLFHIYAMLHALCGQYFYLPVLAENTELHIGPRDKNSIYSGGFTSWQDESDDPAKRKTLKYWYGWFGRGTDKPSIFRIFWIFLKLLLNKILQLLRLNKIFKRFLKFFRTQFLNKKK